MDMEHTEKERLVKERKTIEHESEAAMECKDKGT